MLNSLKTMLKKIEIRVAAQEAAQVKHEAENVKQEA